MTDPPTRRQRQTSPASPPPPEGSSCPVRAALNQQEVQRELHQMVRGLCSARGIRNAEAVREVVETLQVQLLERAATYDPQRGTVVGWASGFFAFILAERARTYAAELSLSCAADYSEAGEAAVFDAIHSRAEGPHPDELDRLEHLLSGVTEETRNIITLRHLVGLEYDEIAERLGISEGAARARVMRGMQALRDVASREERHA